MDMGDFFMKKISFSGSKGLLFNYIFKAIILSFTSLFTLTAAFSFLSLKLDIDEKYFQYISIAILSISSIIVSYFSVSSFKNNGFVVGIISVLPLVIYSLINMIICENNIVVFLIKLALVLILAAVCANFSIKRRKKIRVK